MKKRIIFIAVIAAALLLIGFRYAVVERNDILPEEVRLGLSKWLNIASAETTAPEATPPAPQVESGSADTPIHSDEPTEEPGFAETSVTKESSAENAGDFFVDSEDPTDDEQTAGQDPVLQKGDRGEEVKALQQRLRDLGFLTGKADGIFGAKTEQAVIEFKDHLYELANEHLAREQAERAEAEKSEEDDEAPLPEDGENEALPSEPVAESPTPQETFSPEEDSAQPLPVKPEFTGEVDEETHQLLSEKGFDEYQGTLRLNARGAEVKRLQKRLISLEYLNGKADGIYGRKTQQAVTDFQQRHKLTQDGVAGEKTQRALYSASAKQQVKPEPAKPSSGPSPRTKKQVKNGKYLLEVSTKDQKVYAYAWSDKDNAYTKLARTMVCSTGLSDSPTPKGTFKSVGPVVEWGYFPKYDVWAQYLFRIKGPYLFHSVLFDEADESTVKWGSVNKLGSPASHGCIRLKVEDAKWIYKNCAAGTTVTVY